MANGKLAQPLKNEPHPTDGPDGMMDTKAAAAYLWMKPSTLVDWRVKKIGPPWVACGRAIRYRKSALDAWTDANTFHPQAS